MRSILLRQHDGAFGFRPKRTVEPSAAAVDAATDLEPQAEQPVHGHDGAPVGVVAGQPTAGHRRVAVSSVSHRDGDGRIDSRLISPSYPERDGILNSG
jgi:hypothetical protein